MKTRIKSIVRSPTITMELVLLFVFILCDVRAQETGSGRLIEFFDIPYYESADADTAQHKLNLVIPNQAKAPLFIWISGGAWSYGDRNVEMEFARKVAQGGIAVACPGHRMSPATWKDPKYNTGIRHPAHTRDIARAVKFLYENAQRYGYSKKEIFIGGYSSGAHLAALLAMDKTYLEAEGLSKALFTGVVPVAGMYDVQHYYNVLAESDQALADNHVTSVFGEIPENYAGASPVSYAADLEAPMLLISEASTYRYTKLFEEKLREARFGSLEVLHVLHMTHGELWKDLSRSNNSIYRAFIVDFITRNAAQNRGKP